MLWLALQSTGVVYGDIGTSPLYVFSSTFTEQPSWKDLVGALSIIIWSLTLIVTVKYCFIVLSADDDGQGGTFAVYSLLARYANIVRTDPSGPERIVVRLDRETGAELPPAGRMVRDFLERSRAAKAVLKTVGILGVAMVMADSVLTPAQSVLGAIQGIQVVRPDLGRSAIVGISCAILVFLFLLQPLGTSKIGTTFAPVVMVWLFFNFAVGIVNLVRYDHTVLKAFSPHYAFTYLIRNDSNGWKSLGGLLLAFTGVESLFADLGAFGKKAIQLSWLVLAYPCLLITYCGQAAFIAHDKDETAYTNPFFRTVPEGSFYFSLIIAILAAIVASQALITSSFQLISQLMRLSYFPHIKTVHTSRQFHDQIYMPFANWLLMIGTVVVTAVYNNVSWSSRLSFDHFLTFGIDNESGPCLRCLRHSRDVYHDLSSVSSGTHRLASADLGCAVWIPSLHSPGQHLPQRCNEQGTGWWLVRHRAILHPFNRLHTLAMG